MKYQLGLYEKAMPKLSWKEKFEAAKKAGFDCIEMSIDETDEKLARLTMTDEEIEALRRESVFYGVPISTICLSGHRRFPLGSHDESVRHRSLEIMQQAVRLAKKLGVSLIQLAGYDVYYEEGDETTRQFFLENLKKCVEMASVEGILLGFETMETPFMDTVGKAMQYVNLVQSPYLGVYPDVGNCTNASLVHGHDLIEDLHSGYGHVYAVHLKETVPNVYREVEFGTGHVDFAKVIAAFWKMGVRRYTGEFWYTGSPTWEQDLKDACEFLRGFLDQQ